MTTTSIPPINHAGAPPTAPQIDPRIAQRRAAVAADESRVRRRQLIVVLGLVAVAVVGFAVLHSPVMAVDRVTVTGQVTNPQTIIEASGVAVGTPLINVDIDEARQAIAALPAVAQVTSRRDWSGEIVFDVIEREPVAQITTVDGSALFVDASGRIISRGPAYVDGVGPLTITGLIPADNGVASWVDDFAADSVRLAAAIPDDVVAVSESLEVAPGQYRLHLGNGAAVVLGEPATIDEQMRALRTVLASIDLNCVISIDLQNPASPVIRRGNTCG